MSLASSVMSRAQQISPSLVFRSPPCAKQPYVFFGSELSNIVSNLYERSIEWLNEVEGYMEERLPNNQLQEQIDQMAAFLIQKLAPLTEFNHWLDSKGQGSWHHQMAAFLVKLSVRAARNVIHIIYDLIYTASYAAVHPMMATVLLAKLVVTLMYELSQPETWTRMGVGIIGGSLGQACLSYQPFSVVSIAIGAALALAGLSVETLKHAILAERNHRLEAAAEYLIDRCSQLPETLFTGWTIGLLVGGLQRLIPPTEAQLRTFADQIVKDRNLPVDYEVKMASFSTADMMTPRGTIMITWSRHAATSKLWEKYWVAQQNRHFLRKGWTRLQNEHFSWESNRALPLPKISSALFSSATNGITTE